MEKLEKHKLTEIDNYRFLQAEEPIIPTNRTFYKTEEKKHSQSPIRSICRPETSSRQLEDAAKDEAPKP